jgi:hypothetical protein
MHVGTCDEAHASLFVKPGFSVYLANDAKSHSMGMISAFLTAPGMVAISLRMDCSASMAFCLVLGNGIAGVLAMKNHVIVFCIGESGTCDCKFSPARKNDSIATSSELRSRISADTTVAPRNDLEAMFDVHIL